MARIGSNQRCETCWAFLATTSECRRKAPTITLLHMPEGIAVYPLVNPMEFWCGEWLPTTDGPFPHQ